MPKQIFIPLSDELLFERPELIKGPLVAYTPGMMLGQWLDVELNPDETTAADDFDAAD